LAGSKIPPALSSGKLADDAKDVPSGTYMTPPKGVPIELDPLYLTYLSSIGKRPPKVTGGGSTSRRGLINATNRLFSALYEGGRLDLLPTPRSIRFGRSSTLY
jgi:hypothetical protein